MVADAGAWHPNTAAWFGPLVCRKSGPPLKSVGVIRAVEAAATVPAVTPASGMAARDAIAVMPRMVAR